MIRLYHAPLTRSVRIVWLLEELGLPYELVHVTFAPPSTPFSQATPSGKLPTFEEDGVTMFESGAILEYVLERHGEGRLAPAPGTPERALFLQWIHFAEATAFPPLGQFAWWTLFKPEALRLAAPADDARAMAHASLGVVERALDGKDYLLGTDFSGADIMMGYTVQTAHWLRVLDDRYPRMAAYLARLKARPAYRKALA